tara:strand:- start:1367 stop:2110 length:744 start_codon:yes stop_codon:yes gene_type:complete
VRTRNINELRAIHAKKMYEKNGDIIQALKLKHGNSKLSHPDVFDEGMTRLGHKNLKENADIIAKYSIDPKSKFKIVTPIGLSSGDHSWEESDGGHIQKYLYKGSGKIVEMSPDKFLNIVAPMNSGEQGSFDEKGELKRDENGKIIYTYHTPTSDNAEDYNQSSLEHLRKNMGVTSGEMPNINVRLNDNGFLEVGGHEGRHRAFVAREKGIEKIPVMVATSHSDSIMPDSYKDLIKKEMYQKENQSRR